MNLDIKYKLIKGDETISSSFQIEIPLTDFDPTTVMEGFWVDVDYQPCLEENSMPTHYILPHNIVSIDVI